jgi:hypothetical protein
VKRQIPCISSECGPPSGPSPRSGTFSARSDLIAMPSHSGRVFGTTPVPITEWMEGNWILDSERNALFLRKRVFKQLMQLAM